MNKQEKAHVISNLHESFSSSQAAFLVNYKGLSVKQMQSLRRSLHQQGGTFKVAKARLMRRATEGIGGIEDLKSYLKEQVGLIFVEENSAAVAKILYQFEKANTALKMVAGFLDHQVLDKDSIVRIAQLPSRLELLAQLCRTLNAPTQALAIILNALATNPTIALDQTADKKSD